MSEQTIDRLNIDISVKNSGKNQLSQSKQDLVEVKDSIDKVNNTPVSISVAKNTSNAINNLTQNLKNLETVTKRTQKVSKQLDGQLSFFNADGSIKNYAKSKPQGTLKSSSNVSNIGIPDSKEFKRQVEYNTKYLDAYGKLTKEYSTLLTNKNKYVTYKDAFGNITKEVADVGKLRTISEYTKDITNGITKQNYVIDENGKKWLQSQTNTKQTEDGITKLTQQFDQYGKVIKETTTLTDRFGNVTNTTSGKINTTKKSLSQLSNSVTGFMAKITIMGYGISQITSLFSNLINESNQYIENLNLFRVTFGKFADSAEEFAETYSTALGLDVSQVMRNMGFFNQIITGFGISTDKAYDMSILLTQLAYDLSSFVNIPIEDAMLKFQSGIAGELEPLRRVGYALDEATLQQIAYNHGIEKSIRTMTQEEKTYLRIMAMYEQSANVMGDLASTIDSPANALRILDQQFTLLKRSIGNVLVPIIQRFIPYIQGATKALTEFANLIATKLGYEIEGVREGAITEYMDEISESAKNAGNEIEGALLPFDNFIAMTETNPNDTSFEFEIPTYDALAGLQKLDTTAEKVYQDIRKIFLNEEGTEFSEQIQGIASALQSVWRVIQNISSVIEKISPALLDVLDVVTSLIGNIITLADKLGILEGIIYTYLAFKIGTKITSLVLGIGTLYTKIDLLKKGMQAFKGVVSTAWVSTKNFFQDLSKNFNELSTHTGTFSQLSNGAKILSLSIGLIGFALGTSLIQAFDSLDSKSKIWVGGLTLLASAILGVATALLVLRGVQSWGTAVPIIMTSIGMGIAGLVTMVKGIQGYATGGFTPETKGSLFMAGEGGKPELMGSVNGKNSVANVNSIESAMENSSYKGMTRALNQYKVSNNNNGDIVLNIDGKELARATVKNNAYQLNKNYKIVLNPR